MVGTMWCRYNRASSPVSVVRSGPKLSELLDLFVVFSPAFSPVRLLQVFWLLEAVIGHVKETSQ